MSEHVKSFQLTADAHDYLVRHSEPLDSVARSLVAETQALGGISIMQIAPEQGALMSILVRAMGAKRAVEVGTFTGYSALCIARALPKDGHLLCCDVSDEWTSIGRRHWEQAGVADRIELRLAPALDTLRALPGTADIDFAFIDADKPSYSAYYEEILTRLRPGGMLIVDNVLWSGKVLDDTAQDDDSKALRAFNRAVARDDRVVRSMIPVADGLYVLLKR